MRTYVVTGAASGIGKATVDLLTSRGDEVIGVDRTSADVTVDLSEPAGRDELVSSVSRLSGGKVDGVLAIAGSLAPVPATVGVNYFGAIATLEGLRPLLGRSGSPRAVVVSSVGALGTCDEELLDALVGGDESRALEVAEKHRDTSVGASNVIYNSTKRAIALWVRQHAPTSAWAGASIALNAIAPGTISTPMIADVVKDEAKLAVLREKAAAPFNGPYAQPSAPAHLMAWLTSEDNSFVTGQVIYIDGGAESLRRPDRY